MEPLASLSLTSSVIQIVDFTGKLISNAKEIYRSADGTLESCQNLRQAAQNLSELSADLYRNTPKNQRLNKSKNLRPRPEDVEGRPNGLRSKRNDLELSSADEQLLRLTEDARELSQGIADAVHKTAAYGDHKTFWSIQQALRAVWNQRNFSALEARLENIRRQIDTALLVSLRHVTIFRSRIYPNRKQGVAESPSDRSNDGVHYPRGLACIHGRRGTASF